MDIHKIVEATLRVTEEEMVQASEPMVEEPMAPEEPMAAEVPEITPELIAQLVEEMPELAEIDQDMLLRGMQVEVEHIDTVGGDIHIVAKITADHIQEFPGQDYYAALEQMEAGLREQPGEEEIPMEEEGVVAQEPRDVRTQTPHSESPFESIKENVEEGHPVDAAPEVSAETPDETPDEEAPAPEEPVEEPVKEEEPKQE